jgi:hypothetical protein
MSCRDCFGDVMMAFQLSSESIFYQPRKNEIDLILRSCGTHIKNIKSVGMKALTLHGGRFS